MIINNTEMQNLYVVEADLNVRSGPGIEYSIIGGIKKYELVDVQYSTNDFAYIGKGRWVCNRYLERYVDGITNEANWKVTTMYNMNMRSGPGTNYYSKGIIQKGTTVKVIKVKNNWFYVQYKNKKFWLSGLYLK